MPNYKDIIELWAHDVLDENHKRDAETHRWLLCWNGETETGFDCGCCLMGYPKCEQYGQCGCICHERINSLSKFLEDHEHV